MKRTITMATNTKKAASVSPQNRKEPPSKVPVAKSDFEHVLKAIDNVMESEKEQAKTSIAAAPTTTTTTTGEATKDAENSGEEETLTQVETDEQKEDNRMDEDTERNGDGLDGDDDEPREEEQEGENNIKAAFLADVHKSLKERLYQIVNPIPDEEYHELARGPYIQQQIEEENQSERRLIAKENAKIKADKAAQRREEKRRAEQLNNELDDHELLDQEALKRARELRVQVRDMAAQRQQQQARILERAIQLAQREVRLITQDILSEEEAVGEEDEEMLQARKEANETRREMLRQLESSLLTLTEALTETVNRSLPSSLRDFRDTVSNIDKSLQKKEQPESLSQTEKAIVSRDNEGSSSLVEQDDFSVLVEQEDEFNDTSNPEFALAAFLSGY